MVFSESILVYQPTRAKALNPTHTQLKIASSISCPYLWRRERSVHSNLSERAIERASERPLWEPDSLCSAGGMSSGPPSVLGGLCLLGSEWGTGLQSSA